MIHRIHIKVGASYYMLLVSNEELSNLERATMTGMRFIKLGVKNYNLSSIEYWWKDGEVALH